MKELSLIDKNFYVNNEICKENVEYFNITEKPFKFYGVELSDNPSMQFVRMDMNVAKAVSEGVGSLAAHTTGGKTAF